MNEIAIRVENLSKRYRIGLKEENHDTLASALVDWVKRPGQNLRRLRKMTRFSENGQEENDVLWALKDVSFEVKQGEVVGVIGRNGAGKSTLLKILSRITQPTSGRVELHGRVSSLLEVGTGFHSELTGRENIYLNGTILGMSRREIAQKFDEIVDFSGVEKFIDTPVKRYSSGMAVRLAFSVAAHLEPEILLIDEVLAVGDAEFQKKCLGKMGEVAEGGRTILFVSHNMAAISNLCPSSLFIHEGKLLLYETSPTVIEAYLNQSSTSFIEPNSITIHDPEFYLKRFTIGQQEDTPSNLYTHNDIVVTFEYELRKDLRGLRIGFDLLTRDGMVVWRTFDDDWVAIDLRPKGNYLSQCTIPKHILKPEIYLIALRIGIHNVRWISNDEHRLRFSLVNTEGVNKRYYKDKRPGLLMPRLEWRIQNNA